MSRYYAISEYDYRDCRSSWQPRIDTLERELSTGMQLRHEEFGGEYHDSVGLLAMLRGIQQLYGRPTFVPPDGPPP